MRDSIAMKARASTAAMWDDCDDAPMSASEWLHWFEARAALPSPPPEKRPDAVPARAIKRCPTLFQPRGWKEEDEAHVQGLMRALQRNPGKKLDPVLVMPIGGDLYVIDGHHRLAAYEAAKVTEPVPVRYFEGTVQEAVLTAGRRNSKDKLPMTAEERHNYAWRLVMLGLGSKARIAEAAGVSERQVAYMRRTRTALGRAADECTTWFEARRLAAGTEREMTEDERRDWRERRVEQLLEKIRRACGPKLSRADVETAAAVMEGLFGRRLPDIIEAMGYVPAPENDDF